MKFELDESERQMVLMCLGHKAAASRGFSWFIGPIAQKLGGREAYEDFKKRKEQELRVTDPANNEPPQRAPWNPMDAGLTPVTCAKHKRNIAFCDCPLP